MMPTLERRSAMTRDKKHANQMASLLDRWVESDESLRSFAAGKRQSYWKLVYWKEKLGKKRVRGVRSSRRAVKHGDGSMVPVRLVFDQLGTATDAGPRAYVVRLRTGIELQVPQGFDAEELSRLLGVIEPC
jgi:hypothetical protein